jgi:hypothetical protein
VLLLPLALFSAPALAASPTPVFVSAFQPRNDESQQLAALIEAFVAEKLSGRHDLQVLRVEDSPSFEDYSARIYMDSCPPGDIVGCTFVVGGRASASWAVTGSVQSLLKGTRVDIDIVDITGARVAVSFRSELETGRDEAFAEGVARVLVAAIAGEVGAEEDIRRKDDEEAGGERDDDAVAAELALLQEELGAFTTTIRRTNVKIGKPKLTEADIAERSVGEGSKPWERLGMLPGDYLRYRNSGMDLPTWRKRSEGRRFQLIIRASGGYLNGPVDAVYYGRYAVQGVQTVDAYSAQSVATGSGATGGVEVGFGVHPLVDVSVRVGGAGGNFDYLISQESTDELDDGRIPEFVRAQQSSLIVGPRATVALLPTSTIRPVFGFGATFMLGTGIADHIIPPDELARFAAQPTWHAEVFGGAEVRINDVLDFYAQVPVSFLLDDGDTQVERATAVSSLEGIQPLSGPTAIGVGVSVGLQVRLFGSKPKDQSALDDTDEP